MKKEYLYPGKLIVAPDSAEITTILGSCVAVALRDQKTRISGLCHYLLDKPSGGDVPSPRYGAIAVPQLVEAMVQAGASKKTIQAKIYGGGSVLGNISVGKDIGQTNIQTARDILAGLKIPILEENVGGTRGRHIVFSTETFGVELEYMRETAPRETSDAPTGAAVIPLGDDARVAVIDASSSICNYFTKALRKNGFNVVGTGTDSAEGYDMIYRHRPDLLVLGIIEQEGDGLAILKQLRKFGKIPPVIIYSFGGSGKEAMAGLELGAVDFVHTPSRFDPNALIMVSNILVEKVKAFLNTGRAAA